MKGMSDNEQIPNKAFISNNLLKFMNENNIGNYTTLLSLEDEEIFKLKGCTVYIILEIQNHRDLIK